MSHIFISYAHSTEKEARRISGALVALGYGVWRDDELLPHHSYAQVIEERLKAAKAVIVVWSAEAVRSEWVQSEADHARADHKLVQLTVDGSALPMPFDRIQCADLSDWSGNADHVGWRRVASSVAELVQGPAERPAGVEPVLDRATFRRQPVGRRPRRWLLWGAAAGTALASVGAGLWIAGAPAFEFLKSAPHRVAVLPFDVIAGGGQAQAFASGLLDDLVASLSTNQVEAVSRLDTVVLREAGGAPRLNRIGSDLLLDGDVEDDGKTFRVRVHLDDPQAHVTLWSKELSGPADDPEALRARVASRAATVAKWAVSPDLRSAWKEPSLVAAYLEGEDEYRNEGGGHAVEIARDVVARAPRLAAGHLLLSAALINSYAPPEDAPPGDQPQTVAESIKEAKTALALDPSGAEPWAQLALDTPLSAWEARERLFAKALAAGPDNPFVAGDYAWFQLYDTGRTYEAVAAQKRDLSKWIPSLQCLASELVNDGLFAQAWATIVEARRLAPDYWEAPIAQFAIAASTRRYADALALLDDPDVKRRVPVETVAVYRQALQAAASGGPAEKKAAVDRVMAGLRDGALLPRDALGWLAGLGDLDDAFHEADVAFSPRAMSAAVGLAFGSTGGTGILFGPATAEMRRDPRFIALAARLGLVDYWRSTGHWADFCDQPGLPYDCRAEAARVSPGRR